MLQKDPAASSSPNLLLELMPAPRADLRGKGRDVMMMPGLANGFRKLFETYLKGASKWAEMPKSMIFKVLSAHEIQTSSPWPYHLLLNGLEWGPSS